MRGAKPGVSNVTPMKLDAPLRIPDAPGNLSEDGRKIWEELAPEMVRHKRLEGRYKHLFAGYCEACADFLRFTGDIAAYGSWYETGDGRNGNQQRQRPVWKQRQDALSNMRGIGALFGMSPVDEQRLGSEGQGSFIEALEKALKGDAGGD